MGKNNRDIVQLFCLASFVADLPPDLHRFCKCFLRALEITLVEENRCHIVQDTGLTIPVPSGGKQLPGFVGNSNRSFSLPHSTKSHTLNNSCSGHQQSCTCCLSFP